MKTFTLSLSLLIAALMINVTTASAQWSYQVNPLSGTGDPTMVGKVQFVSSTEGWISANGPKLLHTLNGGATWNVVTCTTDSVFSFSDPSFNMQFINASTGWVMKTLSTSSTVNFSNAQGAVVYYTTNGGSTWSKSIVASGSGIIGAQLQFVDANNGFATVFNPTSNIGYLYKTTNGGATWSTVGSSFGTDEIELFYFINATTGWTLLINDNPALFQISKTTDGGATWAAQYTDNTSHGIYTMASCGALQFIDAYNGWAVGPNSRIVKTSDGGNSWTSVTPSLTSGLNTYQKCMFMYDANHIWIGEDVPSSTTGQTTSHFLMHTTDGGTTWVQDNISLTSSAYSLFFLNGNTGWLTSDYSSSFTNKGVIAAYHDSGISFSNSYLNGPWLARNFDPDTYFIFDGSGRITEMGVYGGVTGSVIGNYSVTSYGGITGTITIRSISYPLAGQFITADSISITPGLVTGGSLARMNANTLQGNWTGSITNYNNNLALTVNSNGNISNPSNLSGSLFTKDGEMVGFINDTNGGTYWYMMQLNGTYSNQIISGKAQSDYIDISGAISLTLNTTPVTNTAVSTVKVSVQNHQAVIAGINVGDKVTLYSVHGLILDNQIAKAETITINLPAKGVYVVRVGMQSFKVVNN